MSRTARVARPSWSAIASDHAYADQAHLVRELGDLTGVTPTALLRERRGGGVSDSFKTGADAPVTVPPSPIAGAEARVR